MKRETKLSNQWKTVACSGDLIVERAVESKVICAKWMARFREGDNILYRRLTFLSPPSLVESVSVTLTNPQEIIAYAHKALSDFQIGLAEYRKSVFLEWAPYSCHFLKGVIAFREEFGITYHDEWDSGVF